MVRRVETYGHLLGIRTKVVESLNRGLAIRDGVIEVAIGLVVSKGWVVGIGIGAIATAIHVAAHAGVDTNGTAAIDSASDVVAAIHVIYITSAHEHSGRKSLRELIARKIIRWGIDTVDGWHDICHTTTTIDIVNDNGRSIWYLKHQAQRTGHVTMITATVEVTHLTLIENPLRRNLHLCKVVTAKETSHLEVRTFRM